MKQSDRTISPREESLTRYFRRVPALPTHVEAKRWIVLGSGLAMVAVVIWVLAGNACSSLILGGAALCGAGALLWRGGSRMVRDQYGYEKSLVSVFPQPSDREVDRWFGEALAGIRNHSLERLELTAEECEGVDLPPIVGPVVWNVAGIAPEDVVWKPGQDGVARFGVYHVSTLWFAEDHLSIHSCDYDFIRSAVLNEETHEFFYRDIVAVSTREESSSLTLASGCSLTSRQEFRISVANDRYFAVTVGSEQLKRLTGAERLPENGTEQAMRALRTKLKARKSSSLAG